MTYRVREDCRLCGERALSRVLDLPPTPLANEFPSRPDGEQDEFPLWLAACRGCGHVQLPVVVDPERLFRDYVYVSGTSPVFREHFRRYAEDCIARFGLNTGDLVVEIGSNDGTMLRHFADRGMRVLGVDPARDIAARATSDGIDTIANFFDRGIAEYIERDIGKARLVVANNVFAHADDLAEIALGVKKLLEPDGLFLFEVSYLLDVLQGCLFDTVYSEHLSYHSITPLVGFFRRLGMSLVSVQRVNTHGGSIRVTVSPRPNVAIDGVTDHWMMEESLIGLDVDPRPAFEALGRTIEARRNELVAILRAARLAGGVIAGYGAPAKATTLIRTFGIEDMIDYVIDDSPLKQGRWMPGGQIPVLSSSALVDHRRPSHIVILAWNFADSILTKLAPYRIAGGTCIVPLPTVRII